MRWRWAVLASLIGLQGCSLPPPTVFAMLERGAIVFHIREAGLFWGQIFGWDDGRYIVDRFWITQGKRTIVSLTPDASSRAGCGSANTFPVTLVEARCGFAWKGRRNDLRPGEVYAIRLRARQKEPNSLCMERGESTDACRYDSWWSDGIVGAFRIERDGRVVNLRPSEFPDECGADDAQQGTVEEEWAEHCLTKPQREGIEEQGGAAENGAGR